MSHHLWQSHSVLFEVAISLVYLPSSISILSFFTLLLSCTVVKCNLEEEASCSFSWRRKLLRSSDTHHTHCRFQSPETFLLNHFSCLRYKKLSCFSFLHRFQEKFVWPCLSIMIWKETNWIIFSFPQSLRFHSLWEALHGNLLKFLRRQFYLSSFTRRVHVVTVKKFLQNIWKSFTSLMRSYLIRSKRKGSKYTKWRWCSPELLFFIWEWDLILPNGMSPYFIQVCFFFCVMTSGKE
jgi:hypothetical protein